MPKKRSKLTAPNPWDVIKETTRERLTRESAAIWAPFPNSPQEAAYHCAAEELFFGGSAGGGKSSAIVGLALTRHHRSLLLRRQAVQVTDLVDQLKRFAGKNYNWRGLGHGGTMTTEDGRTIEVGGCDIEDDKEKYAGRPHDLIALDECSHFSRSQFRFIVAWNRHENPKQRCRVILTGNPPSSNDGRWVLEEFAPWLDNEFKNPANPGELRWWTTLDGELKWLDSGEPFRHKGELIRPKSRTFIPARLADNPILSATDYGSRLQALPEPLRSQLLYGDFNVGTSDDAWQVIPTEWVRKAMARWKPEPPPVPQTALGVDIARGGKDSTIIAERRQTWFAKLRKYPGKSTPDGPAVAALVLQQHRDTSFINLDIVNVGGSVYDILREQKWLTVNAINNSSSGKPYRDSSGRLKFVNVRAASYWRMRDDLDPTTGRNLMLPPDNELLADLTAPRYSVGTGGILIEAKEDIKKRIGRSPDCGDAVVLANWEPRRPAGTLYVFSGRRCDKRLRIVVCSRAELEEMQPVVDPALLIVIADPGTEGIPAHPLTALVGTEIVRFADVDPADYRETWGQPVPPWNLPITEVAMTRDHAKKIWVAFNQANKRDTPPKVVVVVDDGDRRAKSVAYAMAEMLSLPRGETVWEAGNPEGRPSKDAPNGYVFTTMKQSRHDMP